MEFLLTVIIISPLIAAFVGYAFRSKRVRLTWLAQGFPC